MHIDSFIHDLIDSKIISLEYIKTENWFVNFFTKALHGFGFDSLKKSNRYEFYLAAQLYLIYLILVCFS